MMRYWEKILNDTLNQRKDPNCTGYPSTAPKASKPKPKTSESHFLGKNFPGIYLTPREAECMMNFLEEKTVPEAAVYLNLSPRTVEFYLKNMKIKLECKTKSELINKIRESDFSKNYLKNADCENNHQASSP